MARMRFAPSEEAVGAARRFVAGMIVDARPDVQDSVSLMVSELSTNALVHAASGFDVFVERSDLTVFVSVSDRGDGAPVLRSPESSEPHGRGLRIVEALSDEWGISSESDQGKTVWFRISLQPSRMRGLARGAAGAATIDPEDQSDQPPAPLESPVTAADEAQAGTPRSRQGPGRSSRVRATTSSPRRRRVRSAQ